MVFFIKVAIKTFNFWQVNQYVLEESHFTKLMFILLSPNVLCMYYFRNTLPLVNILQLKKISNMRVHTSLLQLIICITKNNNELTKHIIVDKSAIFIIIITLYYLVLYLS